jgi:hypothetical protein
MTLFRAFRAVTCCTIACTLVGVGLGAAMGYFAPDYYYATLPRDIRFSLDPVHIGIANGVNMGLFSGIVIGLIIVAIVTYYELRSARPVEPPEGDSPRESGISADQPTTAIRANRREEP